MSTPTAHAVTWTPIAAKTEAQIGLAVAWRRLVHSQQRFTVPAPFAYIDTKGLGVRTSHRSRRRFSHWQLALHSSLGLPGGYLAALYHHCHIFSRFSLFISHINLCPTVSEPTPQPTPPSLFPGEQLGISECLTSFRACKFDALLFSALLDSVPLALPTSFGAFDSPTGGHGGIEYPICASRLPELHMWLPQLRPGGQAPVVV